MFSRSGNKPNYLNYVCGSDVMQLLLIVKTSNEPSRLCHTFRKKLKIVQENPLTRVMELWETPDGTTIYPNLHIGSTTTEVSLKDVIIQNKPL